MWTYNIIKTSEYKINKWSGGETTELKIYPEDSSLGERNFIYRISSATVEDEESVFSAFEGYERFITPLEGKMSLEHSNHHSVDLNEYDIDYFSGNWTTKSKGKCRDFNFILKEGIEGSMDLINSNFSNSSERIYIYSFKDDLDISVEGEINNRHIDLSKGNLLEIINVNRKNLNIEFNSSVSDIIVISINL